MKSADEQRPRLCPKSHEAIGARLRSNYESTVAAPVPNDQIELLLALRRKLREQASHAK